MFFSKKKVSGFTLIELSILLVIIASISMTLATTNERITGLRERIDTRKQLVLLKKQLRKYVRQYGSYPCPADGTLAISNANYGRGQGTGTGTCAGTIDRVAGTPPSGDVVVGVVPVKDLNLSPSDMLDGWGRRIMYAVYEEVTSPTTFTSACPNIIVLKDYNSGLTPTTQANSDIETRNTAYVFVSFGEDGVGAYPKEGGVNRIQPQVKTAGTFIDSLRQLNNHHIHTSGANFTANTFDRVFVKPQAPFGTAASPVQFDDMVEWSYIDMPFSDPLDIQGARTWFDSDDIGSLYQTTDCSTTAVAADGDPVACWKDKACSNNNLVQATASKQPVYDTNGLALTAGVWSGKPVVRFDGTDDWLGTPYFPAPYLQQPNTVFIVAKRDTTNPSNSYYYSSGNSGGGKASCDNVNGNSLPWIIFYYGDKYSIDAGSSIAGGFTDTSPEIVTAVWNTTNSALYVNGHKVASGDVGTGSMNSIFLARQDSAEGYPLSGFIAEMIVYNRLLTATERKTIESYLANKWGISSMANNNGLVLWLDANDTETLLPYMGDCCYAMYALPKNTWKDKSGYGHDATQGNSTKQPLHIYASPSGKRGMFFDGNDYMQTPVFTSPGIYQPNTIFTVGRRVDATTSGNYFYDGLDSSNRHTNQIDLSSNYRTNAGTNFSTSAATNNIEVHTTVFNTTSTEHYVNGVLKGTGDAGSDDLTGLTIGADNSFGNNLIGTINEIQVYNRAVTGTERSDIENGLMAKWGVNKSKDLVVWFDGDDASTIYETYDCTTTLATNGNPVGCWKDKGTYGFNARQLDANPTNKPTYRTNVLNAKPVIDFDGLSPFNGDLLDTYFFNYDTSNNRLLPQPYTQFVVAKPDTTNSQPIVSNCHACPISPLTNLYVANDNNILFTGSSYSIWASWSGISGGTADTVNAVIHSDIYDSTKSEMYINGSLVGSGTVDLRYIYQIELGGFASYGRFDGYIAEYRLYNYRMTAAERCAVESTLGTKWGIATPAC